MLDLFKEYERVCDSLTEVDATETNINILPYYIVFGNESERQRDLSVVKASKKKLLDEKHALLEKIQRLAEKEKWVVSEAQKQLIRAV